MEYEVSLVDKKGNVIFNSTGVTYDGKLSSLPKDYKLPRTYAIKNNLTNNELYSQLINHTGKTLRLESDQINGLFEVKQGDNEILLKEVLD